MLLTIEGKDEDGARESVLGGRVAVVSFPAMSDRRLDFLCGSVSLPFCGS